jgi:hypothetical protein
MAEFRLPIAPMLVRYRFAIVVGGVVSSMLSGCLLDPTPIGTTSSPTIFYQESQGSMTAREVTTPQPSPSSPRGTLVAKKETRESAKTRAECQEQADKLLSGSEKRDYIKQCMSDKR